MHPNHQQPQQSYPPNTAMQLPFSNAAESNKNSFVQGDNNSISVGRNLMSNSNNNNSVQVQFFPTISGQTIPNRSNDKTKRPKPVTNDDCKVQFCSDGKTVLLPHSLLPPKRSCITDEHAKACIHLWPKLDPKQANKGVVFQISVGEIEAYREYLKKLFDHIQSTGREALKQHIVRNFRHAGYTVNGESVCTFDDVHEVLKSDFFKGRGPHAMRVMFKLIHSCNHETSSFVKDELPDVVNRTGTALSFSMPFAISKASDGQRNHSLVRVANSGSERIMDQFRTLSLSKFGMYISKSKQIPKSLDAIIVPTNYYQEYLFARDMKCYLIVSKNILCETLQNSKDATLEDIEKFLENSAIHPMFSKHLFDYATTAVVSGLSLDQAIFHLRSAYDAITPSMRQYPGLTPPVKTVERGNEVHSPPYPSNLFHPSIKPALVKKTVTKESKLSHDFSPMKCPIVPSPIKSPINTTDHCDVIDEFCSIPNTPVQNESVSNEVCPSLPFLTFMYHFVSCES